MDDEPDLVVLLYRADWTRLSLSAEVRGVIDWTLKAQVGRPTGPASFGLIKIEFPPIGERDPQEHRARLRVAPGGRYRVDILQGFEDEDLGAHGGVPRTRYGTRPGLPPPYPELLWPSSLLNAYSTELLERVEVAGRRALRIAAVAVPGVWQAGEHTRPERIEAIADEETGILLRYEEFLDGQTVQLTELTDVTFEPAGEFRIPDDADEDGEEPAASPPLFSGPDWAKVRSAVGVVRTAVNVVGPVLGPAIRHAPRWPFGAAADADAEAAMTPAGDRFDPLIAGSPASDELLYALYCSGRAAFSATLHQWFDGEAFGEQARTWTSDHGWGGIGPVAGALGDRLGGTHQVTRVALAGDGRYRLDFQRANRSHGPKAVACDGTRYWQEYDDRVIVGPVLPLEQARTRGRRIVEMVDTSGLLACHLSNVAETEVAGRRGFVVRAAEDGLPARVKAWQPKGSDVVVDAELGIALRKTSYVGDNRVMCYESRDVAALSADGSEFTLDIPFGIRVERTDGGLLDEMDMPHGVRSALRSAGSAARAAGSAAKAARGFIDSLSGHRE